MKMTSVKKVLSFILCMVLIAAMALCTGGCKDDKTDGKETSQESSFADGSVLGEGQTEFAFKVVGVDGKETAFTVKTDKKTVGEALQDVGLIAGEMGDFGLYVKTVNGTALDYDRDGKYWAFYINGEYGMTGVDTTEIAEGDSYAFKAE